MLLEIKVKDFAIIQQIQVSFTDGLNILSGETGAGKSVLLKGLSLLMGEKANSSAVRTGADSAVIEGFFDLSKRSDILEQLKAQGIDCEEETLAVRRVISAVGKSRVYLNGSLCSLNDLRELVSPLIQLTGQTAPLIEMTGQHDNRFLQTRTFHLDLVDYYTGSWEMRQQVTVLVNELKGFQAEKESLLDSSRNQLQRIDFLTFQRDEIKRLNLNPGDEEDLENRVKRLKNTKQLGEFAANAEYELYSSDSSVLVGLHSLIQRAQELAKHDSDLTQKVEPLIQARALLEEAVYDLRDYGKQLTADPESLSKDEDQLSQLRKLQRKYGQSVNDILEAYKDIEDELSQIENAEERLQQIDQDIERVRKKAEKLADKLHERRVNGAKVLGQSVNSELKELNMKGVLFSIETSTTTELSATGKTQLEFMIQASKKDAKRPLAKIASGGELSRILLALKTVAGEEANPRTYLFDEVDAGVSGETAEKVGRKLHEIAKGQQVICITHLPQVASFADSHFFISKKAGSKGVAMSVNILDKDKQTHEIARLISGEKITKTSLEHAKELLQNK